MFISSVFLQCLCLCPGMDTSPFQLAQPSYSSDEGEAHTPSRSRSTSSQSRRVVGFPALSTSDDWSPVSILQREGQGRGSEPPKQPMSRASSLSEALQQQHALQQAHLQPLGPRRLSIKTTASAKSSGGGRGLALQLQRAQSSQQAPTQPAAGAWGLPAPPALHPFDATAPTGSELLRSSPLSRQASANVEIPRWAALLPEELGCLGGRSPSSRQLNAGLLGQALSARAVCWASWKMRFSAVHALCKCCCMG